MRNRLSTVIAQAIAMIAVLALSLGWGADMLSAQEYSYASQVLIDQPLAYWRLGETSGTLAVNIGGLGSAVDGTYTNGVTLGEPGLVPGEIDSAARFDGSNDLVDIPGHPAINEGGPYVERTVELWFQADDVSGRQVLYEEGGSLRGLNVYLDDDALYANIYNIYSDDPHEPLWGPVYISTTISAGSTYHAALRVTGGYTSTGAIQGYLNGALFGAADGVGFLYAHDDPIGIGGENGETYYHDGAGASGEAGFSGVIDEVALYDYALSANRIRVHAVRAMDISKQADPPGAVAPGDTLTYSVAITTSTIASDLTMSDTLPGGTSYVANSGYVTTTNPFVRATEYYIASGQFTTTTYSLQLMYDLAPDYLAIIQGSDGSAVYDSRTYLGPDKNYAALVADPFGTGDLAESSGPRTIQLQRGGVISGTDQGWVGVVTVVESLEDQEGSGFELLDVLQVTHTGVLTSGTDSSTSWGDDIDQVMLLGGYNGAGCSTVVTSSFDNKVCHARIWPSDSNTVNWTRDDVSGTLDTATSTVMVVEWGADWTVQRVRVQGSNGGDGADEVDEYNTAWLDESVARDNTWVWGTGHTELWGIGAAAEGVLITLGNGVTQNATESQVAVSLEEAEENAVDFEVYALTHPDLQVDYRFKEDGNDYDLVVPVPVDAAGGNRFALVYNGQTGTLQGYPRPMLSARYVADDMVLLGRRLAEQAWPAWVQGIDLSGLSEESTQNGNPSTLLGSTYTLGAGQTMALTYRVSLDTPWSGGSVITNTVAITSAEMSSPATSIVTNTVTTSSPLITVTKQGPSTAQVGDVVTYTFTVAHAPGSDGSPVADVALVDDVAGPATLVSGDDGDDLLEGAETWVYTATYTIQPSDASPLTNTGTLTGEDGDGDAVTVSAFHSLDIDYAPLLTITKEGPATAQVGDVVLYTFTVAHAPGSDGSLVANVALVDDVAGPATFVSGDDGDDLLEDGETWVYTATYTIQEGDPEPLVNTGTVTGDDEDGDPVSASASHSLDIDYAPTLTITKQGPSTAQVGDVALYTFTVAHAPGSDGSPVANVALVDDVAGPATLVSGDDGDDLLEGSETWVYTALHTITLADPDPLANTGTVTGEDGDGDAVTASASHSLDIDYAPTLTITKEGPATAQVGDVALYTFTVAHAPGSDGSPVASVALVDDLAGPATLVSGDDGNGLLENGETWIYTATYTIQASDASPLTNTGTVTGLDGDGDVVTASASHSVDIGYAPALTITKQGPATAQVGDVVTYTFTVAHAPGSDGSPVANVALVDDVAGPATFVSGDDGDDLLEDGETWVYTATYTIQASDASPLTNTGTVTGVDGDGDAVTASDSHSLARAYVLFMPYVARGSSGPN